MLRRWPVSPGRGEREYLERMRDAHLRPYQVTDVKVEKTDFSKVVCPGETIIWDAGKGLKVGDERSVTFTARRVKD